MTACGLVPMGFVFFYALHDTFMGNSFVWVGLDWFVEVLASPDFHGAAARSLGFATLLLLIEVPLGLFIALRMPTRGFLSALYIVLLAIPLLTPSIVVGYLWKILVAHKAGLLFETAAALGVHYDMNNPIVVWLTLAAMDAWHWTSLIVLLCFAGLRAIPEDYYRAARIDGASRWAVFRYIQLPKLRMVLLIGILLRFMDGFMIYSEAYVVTRGGPGVATTFLSHELVQTALIQFDLGQGGALAVIYFAIIATFALILFRLIMPKVGSGAAA
ncbi:MAG: sugar ABC transporter permease [Rhodospirillaceae bacterium]|nr:sugar ABC transporter permease [Rhodospirillaceae bacterium]